MARDPRSTHSTVVMTCGSSHTQKASIGFNWMYNNGGALPDSAADTGLINAIIAFLKTTPTGGAGHLSTYMGKQFSTAAGANEVVLYSMDLTDPHHYLGSPRTITNFAFSDVGSVGIAPNESAAVVSYRAGYGTDPEHSGSTRPRASDRGRIYLGPLDSGCFIMDTTTAGLSTCHLQPTFVTLLKAAINTLHSTTAALNWQLAVWSRKEQALKPAVSYAVDAEVDTQRRRSAQTSLQTWLAFT